MKTVSAISAMTILMLCITISPAGWAWEEQRVLSYILEHHPVLRAQADAAEAEKLLNRLPVLQAMAYERYQAASDLVEAEISVVSAQQSASGRKAAAEAALSQATTEPERAKARQALRTAEQDAQADLAAAQTTLERQRAAAEREDYYSRRRYALTEIGQLRRRLADKSTRHLAQEIKTAEIRQQVLGNLAKLRELEAEQVAAETRLGFLKSKSGWLQKQVAQGQPESDLWENAKQQTGETATLKRVERLIDSQRHQVALQAGERWEWLYRYLSEVK